MHNTYHKQEKQGCKGKAHHEKEKGKLERSKTDKPETNCHAHQPTRSLFPPFTTVGSTGSAAFPHSKGAETTKRPTKWNQVVDTRQLDAYASATLKTNAETRFLFPFGGHVFVFC